MVIAALPSPRLQKLRPFRTGLALVRLAWMNSLNFRAEIISWLLMKILGLWLMILVWQAIFPPQSNPELATYLVWYTFGAFVIDQFTATDFESWRCQQIREGRIDYYFTRPISYLWEIVWSKLGADMFSWFLVSPIVLGVGWLISQTWTLPPITWSTALILLALVVFGWTLQVTLGLYIILANFWIESSEGFVHFKWLMAALVSGSIMPIRFLPPLLRVATVFSPLYLAYGRPLELWLNPTEQLSPFHIALLFGSLVVLWAGLKVFWQQSLKRYTSFGG